jgi:D-cysteine desulfhydrase
MSPAPPLVQIGTYPTPVQHLAALSRKETSLWVKRDDLTNPIYGGNKIRKIEKLLAEAKVRGARRIVTVGAVGSNYVLATGIFALPLGFEVDAVVVPQPRTQHVVDNLRADLAQGITLLPASSYVHAAMLVASRLGRGAYYIPAGGSNRIGVTGYVDAVTELAAQVRAGEMPTPDLVVVALGSGGTVAGLLAGLAAEGMKSRVLGVTVAQPAWIAEGQARSLAKQCAPKGALKDLPKRLEIDRRYLGRGYGYPTAKGESAMAEAAKVGLSLDLTYTAKAFAAALDRVAEGRDRTILFWHTLSSARMDSLLRAAPDERAIDGKLTSLLRNFG